MGIYTKIHEKNASIYEAITAQPTYMGALAESGNHGKNLYEMRTLYVKKIISNRLNPGTKAAINTRFLEAWRKARGEANLPIELGDTQGGLPPRHYSE